MTSLTDIVSQLSDALSSNDQPDKARLLELVAKLEPLAARDWARIKKLERRLEAFAGANPEELEQKLKDAETLRSELARTKQALSEQEQMRATLAKEAADKEAQLSQSLSEEKAAVARLVLDAGLTSELSKAHVKPNLLNAAKALIREKGILAVEGEGDVRRAVAKRLRDGAEETVSLADWVREYLDSEEGKEFVAAKENAGAGAGEHRSPAHTGTSGTPLRAEEFWNLPAKARSQYIARGGTIVED